MGITESVKNALDTVGCFVPEGNEDFDLREYLFDSLTFISFMIEIENLLGISLPDEVLNFELLASFNGFVELIGEYTKEKQALEVTV